MTLAPVVVAEEVAVAAAKGLVRLTPARKSRTSSVEASASPAELGIDTGAGVVVDLHSDPDDAVMDGSVRMSRIRFMVDMGCLQRWTEVVFVVIVLWRAALLVVCCWSIPRCDPSCKTE